MAKYLVIGQGSMGTRRVRCLLANGIGSERILVYDAKQERVLESMEKYGMKSVPDCRTVRRALHYLCITPKATIGHDRRNSIHMHDVIDFGPRRHWHGQRLRTFSSPLLL